MEIDLSGIKESLAAWQKALNKADTSMDHLTMFVLLWHTALLQLSVVLFLVANHTKEEDQPVLDDIEQVIMQGQELSHQTFQRLGI